MGVLFMPDSRWLFGIVLAGEVSRYAFSAKPFSIYGLSPTSQGLGYLSNDEHARKHRNIFSRRLLKTYACRISITAVFTINYFNDGRLLTHGQDLPDGPAVFRP